MPDSLRLRVRGKGLETEEGEEEEEEVEEEEEEGGRAPVISKPGRMNDFVKLMVSVLSGACCAFSARARERNFLPRSGWGLG